MGTPKAGGTNVYATATTPTASELVDFLETQLVAAGWTIDSGGGTDAVTFVSAQTANGSYGCRLITSVSSGVMRLKFDTYAGGSPQTNYCGALNPSTVTDWRILANRYGFTLFEEGSLGSNTRKWFLCSLLYAPSDIAGDSSCQFVALSDARTDTANPTGSIRNMLYKDSTYFTFLTVSNGVREESYNSTDSAAKGAPRWGNVGLERTLAQNINASFDETWFNGDPCVQVASMYFGGTAWATTMPRLQGYVFDMVIIVGQTRSELDELTFDGDTYVVFGGAVATLDAPAFALAWLKPAA